MARLMSISFHVKRAAPWSPRIRAPLGATRPPSWCILDGIPVCQSFYPGHRCACQSASRRRQRRRAHRRTQFHTECNYWSCRPQRVAVGSTKTHHRRVSPTWRVMWTPRSSAIAMSLVVSHAPAFWMPSLPLTERWRVSLRRSASACRTASSPRPRTARGPHWNAVRIGRLLDDILDQQPRRLGQLAEGRATHRAVLLDLVPPAEARDEPLVAGGPVQGKTPPGSNNLSEQDLRPLRGASGAASSPAPPRSGARCRAPLRGGGEALATRTSSTDRAPGAARSGAADGRTRCRSRSRKSRAPGRSSRRSRSAPRTRRAAPPAGPPPAPGSPRTSP